MNEWQYVTNRNGYSIYRKIVNGKGKWKAKKDGTDKMFDITYNQALGYEGIDNAEKLGIELGKLLGMENWRQRDEVD